MNRDELLVACFPDSEASSPDGMPAGSRILEMIDGGDVLSHLDLSYRRVLVHRATSSPGAGIVDASATLTVAAISNVCTDPAFRGQGYASALILSAHEEARAHSMVGYAVLFSTYVGFYERFGYAHPDGAPEHLLVACLTEEPWPAGRVDTRGAW